MSIFSKLKKRFVAETEKEVVKGTSKVQAEPKTKATKVTKVKEAKVSKVKEAKKETKEKKVSHKQTLLHAVLKNPTITEKSAKMQENGEYVFDVALTAKKPTIAAAVRERYGVDVVSVRTMRRRGKYVAMGRTYGKRSDVKKAIVRVAKGQTIQIFEQEEVK